MQDQLLFKHWFRNTATNLPWSLPYFKPNLLFKYQPSFEPLHNKMLSHENRLSVYIQYYWQQMAKLSLLDYLLGQKFSINYRLSITLV